MRYLLFLLTVIAVAALAIFLPPHLARRDYRQQLAERPPAITRNADGSVTLHNPIAETGQDPYVIALDSNRYLYVYSDHTAICGKISDNIYDWDKREPAWYWEGHTGGAAGAGVKAITDFWAPEAHRVNGQWVIYFAANRGEALYKGLHRTHTLRAVGNDPSKGFEYNGPLDLQEDAFAIDATHLNVSGTDYLVWSGSTAPGELDQKLYITELADAFTPVGERVLISEPEHDWELRGRRLGLWPSINEGPQVLQRGGTTHLLYSASGSWSDHYAFGLLTLQPGADPLSPASWTKQPTPFLASGNGVLAPGHGHIIGYRGRDYLIYHAAKYSGAGWDREVHLQPVTYGQDGTPQTEAPWGRSESLPL